MDKAVGRRQNMKKWTRDEVGLMKEWIKENPKQYVSSKVLLGELGGLFHERTVD
jgi:hypothetical protein